MKNIKSKIWEILEPSKELKPPSWILSLFIIVLIVVNVILNTLATVQMIEARYRAFLYYFELVSVIIFTFEYLARVWTCTKDHKYSKSILGRIRFFFTPMALVDFFAILPFYISLGGISLIELRLFRIFRLFRLAKLGRYFSSLKIIRNAFSSKKEELILSVFIMFSIVIVLSSLMYYAENSVQPEKFSSIPAAMTAITLTTVGYGTVAPVTVLGKILAACNAIVGIGMLALPTAIISAGLIEEIEKIKKKTHIICPHCNRLIE